MTGLAGRVLRFPVVVLRWVGVALGVLAWLVVVPVVELVRGVAGRLRRGRGPVEEAPAGETHAERGVVPIEAGRGGEAVEAGVRARRRASAEP